MTHKTEIEIILYYLNNLLKRPRYAQLENRVCDWFEEHSRDLIGEDIEEFWDARHRRRRGRPLEGDGKMMSRDYKTIRKLLKGRTGRLTYTPEVSAVIEAFHLSPEYHDVLILRVYASVISQLSNLVESHHNVPPPQIFAGMMNLPQRRYDKFFSPTGELIEKGLFEMHRYKDQHEMTDTLGEILSAHCRSAEAVKRVVLGKPQKGTLKPEHFEHLEEEYVWVRNLLSSALEKRQRGVNILIYGNPGTGKTEVAKTLCKEIDVSLYTVSGNSSDELNGVGRRGELAAALTLLRDDTRSVLLMDEAEDVFGVSNSLGRIFGFRVPDAAAHGKSKLFFNKLLETNEVPVVWISNSIRGVDPAHLRRFSYAMNMETPNDTVQARIWTHAAKKNKVKLSKEKIAGLVKSYDIAPSIIDTSLRTAALTGDHEAIEKTVESLQTAMYGQPSRRKFVQEHPFSTELLNCDTDLEKLTRRIEGLKGVNFSLCLYGVPGSGKSAYARHLAERLNMKVLHKRASDLLDCYVGETEHLIAAAFAEARKKKMLLVFDEADSFLQDRRNAYRSWEVTRVNEMLTQMESHPLPFVCTTNLMDDLDQASLRRFTFKVKYDFLTRKQVATAFRHFFGTESSVSLSGLSNLTPGDFAVVAKRARIEGIADQSELVDMLRQEQDVKDVKRGSLGFAGH